MAKLLLLLYFMALNCFSQETVISCKVSFFIQNSYYSASYEIFQEENRYSALYQSPFNNSDEVQTENIAVIEYDYNLVQKYFTGEYRDNMSQIGGFNPEDVYHITQYGIDMNGNSAKAQILLFFNKSHQALAKIVYPSYYPMRCHE